MGITNSEVDQFVKEGSVWPKEVAKLRAILQRTALEEHFKWRLPCYTFNGSNVVIIQPFKAYLGLMFFKGTLLKDPKKILVKNGPNSQASKRFEFRSVEEVTRLSSLIRAYVREAIEIEESGQKVKLKKKPVTMPSELKTYLGQHPAFKKAFAALTPGRQRAYILFFTSAKQAATREARIEKMKSRILAGKGLND